MSPTAPVANSSLSPAEAQAILDQDFANILLKVQERRPLTAREQDQVRGRMQPEGVSSALAPPAGPTAAPRWAENKVELASILGVDRRTLTNWQAKPDCPTAAANGRYEIVKWQAFARTMGHAGAGGGGDDKASLQAEEIRLRNEDRREKMAMRRGEWTPNAQIGAEVAALVHEAVTLLRSKFERELPGLYEGGGDERDRALNRAAIDEVCERLSRPLPCAEKVGPAGDPDAGGEEEGEGDQ